MYFIIKSLYEVGRDCYCHYHMYECDIFHKNRCVFAPSSYDIHNFFFRPLPSLIEWWYNDKSSSLRLSFSEGMFASLGLCKVLHDQQLIRLSKIVSSSHPWASCSFSCSHLNIITLFNRCIVDLIVYSLLTRPGLFLFR